MHRTPDGEPVREEVICPRHIAVLVRTHANAQLICAELEAARIPAVINGGGNVFETTTARAWLRLLEALERPASTLRARTAAATPFLGWSGERIAAAGESEWEEVHRRLHQWSRILRDSGVAALTEAIVVSEDLAARMLVETAGERRLTDLNHIAQLLHRAAGVDRLGVSALRAWLAERVTDAVREDPEDERTRRLESDAEAVQVLTIHRSKGLEFPVVYCPFLWEPSYIPRDPEPVFFHDPGAGFRRTIDVGLEGRAWDAHVRRHRDEQRGEDLRLAYVALTRAKHQVVIWWAGSFDSRHSPLGRLLFAKNPDGSIAAEGKATPSDQAADQRFAELAALAPETIAVERSAFGGPPSWSPPAEAPVELVAARFERRLDLWWRRTSYSDITSEAHEALVSSEPEQPALADEPSAPTPVAVDEPGSEPTIELESPLGDDAGRPRLRDVRAPGVRVHRLRRGRPRRGAGRAGRRGAGPRGGWTWASRTRSWPACGPRSRRHWARSWTDDVCVTSPSRDRLDELEFELPLAGGDAPTGELTLGAIARVLDEHLPAGDPMAAYAARLADPALRSHVRGFLTGSIDLVIRLDGPRFAIADYKTNWLGPADEPLTLAHYRREALAAEMSRAHYGLQALLYTVALHRYLRWRLPGYDPDRHLAGVLYLFVRGMAGGVGGSGAECSHGIRRGGWSRL